MVGLQVLRLQVFVALWSSLVAGQEGAGWEKGQNEEGKNVQTLKIEAPTMTEEDQYGYNMPDRYKCDSCRAVMYHVDEEFRKKQPASRRLKSWEYTDILDDTCKTAFQGYGIKLVNGQNVLSGPGIKEETALAPGMGAIQMGGESWTKRLSEICRKIVFEKVGEEEVYSYFYNNFQSQEPGSFDGKAFCAKEVGDCTLGPERPPAAAKDEGSAESKPSKAKKDKASNQKKGETAAARKAKASKDAPAEAKAASAGGGKLDVQAFLRSLAPKHGKAADEYLKERTSAEWEKMMVGLAGKIFESRSEL